MAVRIVTDSTSDLPADVIEQLGITVVAQNVHFGTETYKDNVTITPDYLLLDAGFQQGASKDLAGLSGRIQGSL